MENSACNAIIEEVKKDFTEKLVESNERAKKAEKAFVDLTRRRSSVCVADSSHSPALTNTLEQKRTSDTVINAMASVAFPYKSSMEKVRVSWCFSLYNYPCVY